MKPGHSTTLATVALAVAVALTLAAASWAHAADLPAVHHSGDVEYLSGGIGSDESSAIESARSHWPLTLEFAVSGNGHADYVASVRVVLRNATGQVLLDTISEGPYLLARLAPGSYSIDATFKDKALHQLVTVGSQGGAKAVFMWPAADHG